MQDLLLLAQIACTSTDYQLFHECKQINRLLTLACTRLQLLALENMQKVYVIMQKVYVIIHFLCKKQGVQAKE